jgi:hypothetical protein
VRPLLCCCGARGPLASSVCTPFVVTRTPPPMTISRLPRPCESPVQRPTYCLQAASYQIRQIAVQPAAAFQRSALCRGAECIRIQGNWYHLLKGGWEHPRHLAPSVFSLARGTPHAGRGHRLLDGGAGRKGRVVFLFPFLLAFVGHLRYTCVLTVSVPHTVFCTP